MIEVKKGCDYYATIYIDGDEGDCDYEFTIICRSTEIVGGERKPIYLGFLEHGEYSAREDNSGCYWFDEAGVYDSGHIRFVLNETIG